MHRSTQQSHNSTNTDHADHASDLGEHASLLSTLSRAIHGHVRVTGFGLGVLALGLLIWARLMLVTNHPRIAVAEPTPPLHVEAQPVSTTLAPEPVPYPSNPSEHASETIAAHGE